MALEEIINSEIATDKAIDLATAIGSIGLWLKAIGVVIVIWLIIQIVNWFFNHGKLKTLSSIKENLERIEKRLIN